MRWPAMALVGLSRVFVGGIVSIKGAMILAGDDELRRVLAMMNKRGHAHEFATETALDRKIMERMTAQEWARSIRAKFGVVISAIENNDPDPPDCIATLNGTPLSIELTELVDSAILHAIAQARKRGETVSASDQLFDQAQWTRERLKAWLDNRIASKNASYQDRLVVDTLIIHTAETWLSPFDVETWLNVIPFEPKPNIRSVFLLMTYDPSYSTCWPMFRLYDGFLTNG